MKMNYVGIKWEEPLSMIELGMTSLDPQEIIRLKQLLQEQFPEDYI